MPRSKTLPISPSQRILNCLPSREIEKDWTFQDAVQATCVQAAPPPQSVDLREAWWTVGDQGKTGSCVGWASADGLLRWHMVKAGRISQSEGLSVRFVWMSAKESDEFSSYPSTFIENDGTSLKAALDIMRKFGMVTDALLPFTQGMRFQGGANVFYAQAAKLKLGSYFSLGRDQDAWRSWLATAGPILTRLNVDDTWQAASATHGILDTYKAETVRGGHAVCIVGYTPERFIIRNSWNTTWGDQGFAHASLGYSQSAFTEAYGITL